MWRGSEQVRTPCGIGSRRTASTRRASGTMGCAPALAISDQRAEPCSACTGGDLSEIP